MKKAQLRSGQMVELRNGLKGFVLFDSAFIERSNIITGGEIKGYVDLDGYNSDLEYDGDASFDIMVVYSFNSTFTSFDMNRTTDIQWRRDEKIEYVLNKEYKAYIYPKEGIVRVGCQEFTIRAVVDLAVLANQELHKYESTKKL